MRKICGVLFYWLVIVSFSKVHAQPFSGGTSIGVQGHYGSFLTRSPKAEYLRDSYTYFGEVYFQQQTDGSRPWHQANHLPQWGAGIFFGNTGSRQYMGHMAGAFAFMNLPLIKKAAFSSKLRVGLGTGWIQHPYDKEDNHKNVMIGSALNAYINFVWQNEYHIAPNTYINAGLSFSHLSNGGSTLPNLGLNIPALSFGMRYDTRAPAMKHNTSEPAKTPKLSYRIFATAGPKQAPWVESKRYLVNTLQTEVTKHTASNNQYGAGLILFYDRSLEVHPDGIPSSKRKNNKLQAGVYAAYEHNFGRLSVPLQLGAYVFNQDMAPLLFQNLGLRYQFSPKLIAQFLMKTHMGQADHIGLGLGYTIK